MIVCTRNETGRFTMWDAQADADPRTPEQQERERLEALAPRWRFWAGFDRWCYEAMSHREITVACSNSVTHVLDGKGQIWFWDREWQIWLRIGDPAEVHLHAENRAYVAVLRRSVPISRLLMSTRCSGERSAAKEALCRLARSVRRTFQASSTGGLASSCWVGAASLYRDAAQRNRWQIPDLDPPGWSEDVEAGLRKLEQTEFSEFSMRQFELRQWAQRAP